MSKANIKKIECIKNRFKCITGIDVKSRYLKAGKEHKNNVNSLNTEHQCVYIFFSEKLCLKVGYVDQGSPQRWNSHHYTTPIKNKKGKFTGSTLPKSILLDDDTKSKFQDSSDDEIEKLKEELRKLYCTELNEINIKTERQNLSKLIREFIENNTDRVEFSIPKQANTSAIKLLEAIAIFVLNPAYEGKSLSGEETDSCNDSN